MSTRTPQISPFHALVRWGTRLGVLALVASLMIHVVGGVAARYLRWGGSFSLPSAGAGPPVEMAIATDAELQELQELAAGAQPPQVPEEESQAHETPLVDATAPMEAPALTGADSSELASLAGASDLEIGASIGGAGGAAGGAGAKFFGVEAGGNRFAFVLDASGSMSAAGRLQRLKRELKATLDALAPDSEVFIVTFSDRAVVLNERTDWMKATTSGKRELSSRVSAITDADLGSNTLPVPAFEIVFGRLRPKPDAIYFMTDGEFGDGGVPERIAGLNRAEPPLTPIHCINLGAKGAEEQMQRIARMSGGTYSFVSDE